MGWGPSRNPDEIFLGRLVKCTIDKFINITHSGKTESKDCSQFSPDSEVGLIFINLSMKVRSCTSYDLDEPEEAEAVLLEGCEHAEDLTEAVKSSACSALPPLPSSSPISNPSGYDERARGREIKVVASSARRPM